MSRTATIDTCFQDPEALSAACERFGLPTRHRTVTFHDGTTVTGTAIALPGWRYPAVIDADGVLHYDNYNEHWGASAELDRFRVAYSEQAAERTLAQYGYTAVNRYVDEDGWVVIDAAPPAGGFA